MPEDEKEQLMLEIADLRLQIGAYKAQLHALEYAERRERIATAVLGGLSANSTSSYAKDAQVAVHAADALIAELDKEKSDV